MNAFCGNFRETISIVYDVLVVGVLHEISDSSMCSERRPSESRGLESSADIT